MHFVNNIPSFIYYFISVDTTPPTIQSCPSDIDKDVQLGLQDTPVYWSPPIVTDLSGNASLVSQSHLSGQRFSAGRTSVLYIYADGSGNEATCTFTIVIKEGTVIKTHQCIIVFNRYKALKNGNHSICLD